MAFFSWTDSLSVGNTFIDNDHRRLIDLVNALYDAINTGKARNLMGQVLNDLITYTREHFDREEREMQRVNYPMFLNHKHEHDKLMREVDALRQSFDRGDIINAFEVGQMLRGWLLNHIMHVDMDLASALRHPR